MIVNEGGDRKRRKIKQGRTRRIWKMMKAGRRLKQSRYLCVSVIGVIRRK